MANCDETEILKVGDLNKNEPCPEIVRIVHISDTHMNHDWYQSLIPDGDILIHSGDFFNFYDFAGNTLQEDLEEIDKFFGKMPHKHKIFVAGNHERTLDKNYLKRSQDVQQFLPNVTYLEDSAVTVKGIRIYGSPATTSVGMGFYLGEEDRQKIWSKIPENTDILVTHNPPFGIMDFGFNKSWENSGRKNWVCDFCTEKHKSEEPILHGNFAHQGCMALRRTILERVRPKVHLFGHVHNKYGTHKEDGILFSNAALAGEDHRPIVMDYHVNKTPVSDSHVNKTPVSDSHVNKTRLAKLISKLTLNKK